MINRNSIGKFIVTGAGTGYLPIAPGTWGSAAVCVIYLALVVFGNNCPIRTPCLLNIDWIMLGIAIVATIGCGLLGPFIEKTFAKKDPSQCTLDEWAGQAVTFLFLPMAATLPTQVITAGVAFFAFRFFDITKPPPARQFEKFPAGWGIVADDLAAGVYANIAAQLILRLALPAVCFS